MKCATEVMEVYLVLIDMVFILEKDRMPKMTHQKHTQIIEYICINRQL